METASTTNITKPSDTATNPAATSTVSNDGKSFKDELKSNVKTSDATKTHDNSTSNKQTSENKTTTEINVVKPQTEANVKNPQAEANIAKSQPEAEVAKTEQQPILNQQNNVITQNSELISGQVIKMQPAEEKNSKKIGLNSDFKEVSDPLSALKETISTLKNNPDLKTNSVAPKSTFKTDSKIDSEITLKMDDKDISFFLNLVQSDQMTAQIGQTTGAAANTNNQITEIKTQATQQPVQVSAALLDALSQSAQTGRSVRIDFDDNIAVVMKLDKNGAISANFIPGDTAVENYLRNNISLLQQNFNEKNIAYNELTYSKQQKQEQENQRKNNKEQKDE